MQALHQSQEYLEGFSYALSQGLEKFDIQYEKPYYRIYKLFLSDCWHCIGTFRSLEEIKVYFTEAHNCA